MPRRPDVACQAGFDLTLQFFTTRGSPWPCVDYAGSSGYGRDYRDALWGQWGVADAEDCLDAALHLAARGDVDAHRLAIRGGSAGGMTALNALASGEGFGACASWYGVTDLLGLAATTHDFEAHYTDRLIGPLPEAARPLRGALAGDPGRRHGGMRCSCSRAPRRRRAPRAGRAHARRPGIAPDGRATCASSRGRGTGSAGPTPSTACLEAELAFYLEELRPLRFHWGVLPPAHHECEAFATPCRPSDHDSVDRPVALAARPPTRSVRRAGHGASRPSAGDALLYFASALFAFATIYTSTNALYQVWGRMALSPFVFGALASAVLALARCAAPGGAATAPVAAPTPARLAGPIGHRRVRLRRRARPSRWASRSCGASTACPGPTSSPRWRRSRSAGRTSSRARTPTAR